MVRIQSSLLRWSLAIFLSAAIHAFFFRSVIVAADQLRPAVNPQIVFWGAILIPPEVEGEWKNKGRPVDEPAMSAINKGLGKKVSRFSRLANDKPSFVDKIKTVMKNPEKTVFPLDNIVNDEIKHKPVDFFVPHETYEPLRLPFHDTR